jgi:two-component system cell cycle sensor histidine kinase/response regulator CckA
MSELSEPHALADTDPDEAPKAGKSGDTAQIVFWISLAVAAAAAIVALALPGATGMLGPILLVAILVGGLVAGLWLAKGAGRLVGLFPDRNAVGDAVVARPGPLAWVEALDEAALISERGGATLIANAAYRRLSSAAGAVGESDRPVSVDRVFGALPGMAAAIYRLSKAAEARQSLSEVLAPIALGEDGVVKQFEVSVASLPGDRVLWRLKPHSASTSGQLDARTLMVEEAPIGFFAARRDGSVLYANPALLRRLGVDTLPHDLNITDFLVGDGLRLLGQKTGSDGEKRADIRVRGADGIETPALLITRWGRGAGGQPVSRSVLVPGRPASVSMASTSGSPSMKGDVTAAARLLVEAPFGAAHISGDTLETTVILDTNPALTAMTDGIAVPGVRLLDMFVADTEEEIALRLTRSSGKAVEMQIKSNPPRTASVVLMRDAYDRPEAIYMQDVTDQKDLELRLVASEKLEFLGQFAGTIAHEINNMLHGIGLTCDKLNDRHPLGDASHSDVMAIRHFNSRASDMMRSMLAYARKQTMQLRVLNTADLMGEFAPMINRLVGERVSFEIIHGRDVPYVRADKLQLEAVMINIAANARDAMLEKKGGGKLTIRTHRASSDMAHDMGFHEVAQGEYAWIEIEDTGGGIPDEILHKIFERQFTTKEAGKGTGLGLATVYGIIKQSEGYIYPTSKPGQGATFNIFLPAVAPPVAEPEAVVEADVPARTKDSDIIGRERILFVEDEESVRGVMSELLESCGYQVVQAGTGEEGLEIMTENPDGFDLIISDVILPGMDGPTMMREAKPYLGKARIIFISGYAERDLAQTLEAEQQIGFLPKPFTLRQLSERVKQELAV